jgi:hypothetical protein
MHLANINDLKTSKYLKRPAARLTELVGPNPSRPIISLGKMGASNAWRFNMTFMQEPNLK